MHVNAWGNLAWELGQDSLHIRNSIARVGPGTNNRPQGGMMLVHVDDYPSLVKMSDHDADLRRFIARRTVVLIVPNDQIIQIYSLQYGASIIACVLREDEVFEGSALFQQAICPIQLSSKWANLFDQYGPIVTPEWDQRIGLKNFMRMPRALVQHAEVCQGCRNRTSIEILAVEEIIRRQRRMDTKKQSGSLPGAADLIQQIVENVERLSGQKLSPQEREIIRSMFAGREGLDNGSVPVGV